MLPPSFARPLILALAASLGLGAQSAADGAALQAQLDRLRVLGTVLYVAAHPDDENTQVLAALAKGRKVRAAYLSLTRGGGGQNLIGTELGEPLAALRTQELLAARRIDGAEQWFTRCVDFGFSKTPGESLRIWGHDAALADVVWVIRKVRPDVILTRFTPEPGGTHGHHTASAMLALEAFRAAADPAAFPEQLKAVRPWQARRILWNSFRPKEAGATPLDPGAYDPLLGRSYAELAAESRSQHRSQGFGAVPARGTRPETFEPLDGQPAPADLLEGVDLSWNRVPGGAAVDALLVQARAAFRPEDPSGALPFLLQAKAALDRLPDDPWKAVKGPELLEAIRCAAGLWAEATVDRPSAAPGDAVPVTLSIVARLAPDVVLLGADLDAPGPGPRPLAPNRPLIETRTLAIPAGAAPAPDPGAAAPPSPLAGLPESPAAFQARFRLACRGVAFELSVPVVHRFRDPVLGERRNPFVVVPPLLVNVHEPVQILPGAEPRTLRLDVAAGRGPVSGRVLLAPPPGWKAEPAAFDVSLARAGDEARLETRLTPPPAPGGGELAIRVDTGAGPVPALSRRLVDHPHVPLQTLLTPARARLARVDLRMGGRRIGYVMGSGDGIPDMLRPLGYRVDLLGDEELATADLSVYDAVVVGIRAFNTRPRLAQLKARILDYVAGGGTEVVLYDTDQGLVTPALGPFPFTVGRERVTEEDAPMDLLLPGHPVLARPNRIGPADFQGWVQERGLYFARDWDPRYAAPLACADAGEKPLAGSLVAARHGRGWYAYTGLAFFRQLPEGVPGAYRLFANLLALKGAP
ncbi:MAG TPA: PIG-L family deacetylase [Holophaga sp.]|nr:PIG-L family deacetylase [Holophaga sp.]